MHSFRQFISLYTPVSDADWQQIERCLTRLEVPGNILLLAEGTICRHLYFLESGLLRFYTLKDGTEVTNYFAYIPYVCTLQKVFTARQAKESIETVEDSVLWRMPYSDANRLLEIESWRVFIDKLTQTIQLFIQTNATALQSESVEERYRALLATDPSLADRIQYKHMASYLGITQEALHLVRKKIG